MNKLTIRYILIAFLLSVSFTTSAQDILDKYLMEAAENNPGLKSKFSEYMAALEKIPQVGALPDPQITFGFFIQPVETRIGPQRARISASQMFPWFGTLGARKDAVAEIAKSRYEMFEETKSRLFYDVKSTYYNLYFINKVVDITLKNLSILKSLRTLALIKVEAGLASSVDILRVEMEIAELENQLTLSKDNNTVMQRIFNNLLNVDENRFVGIPDSLYCTDFGMTREAALDSIYKGNHEISQIEFMEASYNKQEIVARRTGRPNLMLGFDYMITGKSSNPMVSSSESGQDAIVFPMVGLTIPLYRKKYSSMAKESALMQESANNSKMNKLNQLESAFEKAFRDYKDAERRISLYRELSDKASRSLNILKTSYETDGRNFEDLLRMEQQLLKYEIELEKARSDKNAALAFINYLMGN